MYLLLDTCVLFTPAFRHIFWDLAVEGAVQFCWTADIEQELYRNLEKKNRSPDNLGQAKKFFANLRRIMPDSEITGYAPLIEQIQVPPNAQSDRHVIAAAFVRKVDYIVTDNIKHFSTESLRPYNLTAVSLDEMLCILLDEYSEEIIGAMNRFRKRLLHPPYDTDAFLQMLAGKYKLINFAEALSPYATQL